jgi:hypothetical protein
MRSSCCPPLIWLLLRSDQRISLRIFRCFFLTALLAITPSLVHRLGGVKEAWPLGSSRLYELNAMTIRQPLPVGQNFLLRFITPKQQREMIGGCGAWALVNGGVPAFEAPRLIENRTDINRSWWRAVRAAPSNWLYVRWQMTKCILRAGYGGPDRAFRGTTDGNNNPFKYRTLDSPLLEKIDTWRRIGGLVFFFPYVWGIFGLVLTVWIAIARMRKTQLPLGTPLCLLLAGALCEVGLFATAPTSDHRYSTPMEWAVFFAWLSWLEGWALRARVTRVQRPPAAESTHLDDRSTT